MFGCPFSCVSINLLASAVVCSEAYSQRSIRSNIKEWNRQWDLPLDAEGPLQIYRHQQMTYCVLEEYEWRENKLGSGPGKVHVQCTKIKIDLS